MNRASTGVSLDASTTYDPDQCGEAAAKDGTCVSTGIAYGWECALSSGGKCRSSGGDRAVASFPALGVLSVDLSRLSLEGETHVDMTVRAPVRPRPPWDRERWHLWTLSVMGATGPCVCRVGGS